MDPITREMNLAEKTAYVNQQMTEIRAVQAAMQAGAGPHFPSVASSPDIPGVVHVTCGASTIESLCAIAKEKDPLKRAQIYAKEIKPVVAGGGGTDLLRVIAKNANIQAANSLGTLSGDLIAQQSLDLLKLRFPLLSRITRDFSNQSARLNQQIVTRTIAIPAVTTFVPADGFVPTPATDSDVTVTISEHVYAQIQYNANELASTNRDLFSEQAAACSYALGKYFIDALYALITTTNFSLSPQKTVQALSGFGRPTVMTVAKAMNVRGCEKVNRTLLLNPDYYEQLGLDPAIVSLAVFQRPQIIEANELGAVAGFETVEAVNLPTTSNLVGFGMTPQALIMASRVPIDYAQALPGASYGNVSMITDINSGMTMALTQYVDHNGGTSNYRLSAMFGVAPGDTQRGQLITSA